MIIRYTPAARDDLVQTKEYIETVLKNPIAAKNVTNKIIQKCSILKEQPMCGISLSEKTGRDTGGGRGAGIYENPCAGLW